MKRTITVHAVSTLLLALFFQTMILVHGSSTRHLQDFSTVAVVNETESEMPLEENRIYKGEKANLEDDLPCLVGLRTSTTGQNYCGGVLISETRVLTAASCRHMTSADMMGPFKPPSRTDDIYVSVGSEETDRDRKGERIRVVDMKYASADPNLQHYDAMILVLERPVSEIHRHFATFQGRHRFRDRFIISNTKKATTFGWGHAQPYSDIPSGLEISFMSPGELHKAELSLVSARRCQQFYSFPITSDMVCAGGDYKRLSSKARKAPCVGDTGAPLVSNNKIIGIMAKADTTQCGHKPTIFIRIWPIYRWIQENLRPD